MNYDAIFDAKPRCLWEDEYLIRWLKSLKSDMRYLDMRVLDIASGTGRLVAPVFGSHFVALDIDQGMLDLNPSESRHVGGYEALSGFDFGGFDLVTFLFGVLQNRVQYQHVVNQAFRVLRSNGKFASVILAKGRLDSFIHPELYKWGDFELFSDVDVMEVMISAGFRMSRLKGMTASVYDVMELLLNAQQLSMFIDWHLRSGLGDSGLKFLRWHYWVVEGEKP